MAKTFNVELKGLQKTLDTIAKYDKQLALDVDEQLGLGADRIATKAKSNAPKGKSNALANSIITNKTQKYSKEIEVRAFYAAYVEFGTGSNVFVSPFNFTPEMREFAREFFVNGQGRMHPRPFLFPALLSEKESILIAIRNVALFKRVI